jgi:hypothetical protein
MARDAWADIRNARLQREAEERVAAEALAEQERAAEAAFRESVKGDRGDRGDRGDAGERGLGGPAGRDGRDGRDGVYTMYSASLRGEGGRIVAVLETLSDGTQRRFTVLRDAGGRPVELVVDGIV